MRRITAADLEVWRDTQQPHYIYRCYDAAGVLLYIGCTSNVKKRLAAHRRGDKGASKWLAPCMASHEVDSDIYAGRIAGRAAEALAIRTEQPLFNYQRRAGLNLAAWMTRAPVARYLAEHGHADLARSIA